MKQVIIFRSDIKLGKGKLAAHAAHAGITGYEIVMRINPSIIRLWLNEGQKKIILKVKGEKELLDIYKKAKDLVPCQIIKDAGLTQVEPG
ncbi:MAG: aminoacyl-tRNA hydrolase, partial [Candidatus Micrarchaeia archaeon]